MNREEAIDWLKRLQSDRDIEMAHSTADDILCRLLSGLGYDDVVQEYLKINRWFA
jgi:hypothetical protein